MFYDRIYTLRMPLCYEEMGYKNTQDSLTDQKVNCIILYVCKMLVNLNYYTIISN